MGHDQYISKQPKQRGRKDHTEGSSRDAKAGTEVVMEPEPTGSDCTVEEAKAAALWEEKHKERHQVRQAGHSKDIQPTMDTREG